MFLLCTYTYQILETLSISSIYFLFALLLLLNMYSHPFFSLRLLLLQLILKKHRLSCGQLLKSRWQKIGRSNVERNLQVILVLVDLSLARKVKKKSLSSYVSIITYKTWRSRTNKDLLLSGYELLSKLPSTSKCYHLYFMLKFDW